MHVLGFSCGTPNGNSEILLKIALKEIQTQIPGTTVAIIRIPSVSIPFADPTDPWASDNPAGDSPQQRDDRPAATEAILDADALIIAAPTWSRAPIGVWKYFCDKTLGPKVDVAFARDVAEGRGPPNSQLAKYKPDPRILKPRVAALIALGGSTESEWASLALPGLHQSIFPLHAKVVDQMQVYGCPIPGAILDTEKPEFQRALLKARRLGQNVASQLGKAFDEAKYLGDIDGACPICHLDVVVLNGKDGLDICATCGAKGRLLFDKDQGEGGKGKGRLDLEGQVKTSVITMEGKVRHIAEMRATGAEFHSRKDVWQREHEGFRQMDRFVLKL